MTKDPYRRWPEREAEIRTVILWPHLHREIEDIEVYGWRTSSPTSFKTAAAAATTSKL